jgi:hypothetical protein
MGMKNSVLPVFAIGLGLLLTVSGTMDVPNRSMDQNQPADTVGRTADHPGAIGGAIGNETGTGTDQLRDEQRGDRWRGLFDWDLGPQLPEPARQHPLTLDPTLRMA